jgi:ribonuclease-3
LFAFLSKRKRHPLSVYIYSKFNFYPKNIYLFELAFTHKSASIHHTKDFSINNERLEFLGDSVLNVIIGEYLYYEFPNENEGFLTNLRSKIVSRNNLNEIATILELPKRIKKQNERENLISNIYGNALEALIGAIFLDQGYEKTKKIIIEKIILPFVDIDFLIENDTNYKGQIIDWAQKNYLSIEFVNKEIQLSKNQQGYSSEVFINKELIGKGKGISKKSADQDAAKNALDNIRKKSTNNNEF